MTARHETGAWLNPSRARIGDAMPRTLNDPDPDPRRRPRGFDEQPDDYPANDGAYCDYCEREGHAFSACPKRDDEHDEYESGASWLDEQPADKVLELDGPVFTAPHPSGQVRGANN